MTYSKEFLIDAAMENFSVSFVIARVIRGDNTVEEKHYPRIKAELEEEYDRIGKQSFRKLNGLTALRLKK